jgi:hypothetical protein
MLGSFFSPLVWIVSKLLNMSIRVGSCTINGARNDFQLVGVIGGKLGATKYQGRYHIIHGKPIQGHC